MLKIFMSYAKEDRALVAPYFSRLNAEDFSPWMDVEDLLPGQNWEAEINKAFNDANVVLLFLSPRSVSKRGFVQREANEAIDNLRYKQPTDIYVIPLLLEHCEVPIQISKRLQYEDLQAAGAWDRLLASLRLASTQQQVSSSEGVVHGPFRIFAEEFKEQWGGRPGHNIDISFPRFESASQPAAAAELSSFFRGRTAKIVIQSRQKPWNQSPDLFSDETDEDTTFVGTNGRWDGYGIVHANANLLSLTYTVGWYGAGAAHPNSHFETHNYAILDAKILPIELTDLFDDASAGIRRISDICIKNLQRQYWERCGVEPDADALKWVNNGAGPAEENFVAFSLSADHLTILFSPYQVGAYAFGSWSVDVSFFDLLDLLRKPGIHTMAKA